jgi:ketosteroid isomerase-like protein
MSQENVEILRRAFEAFNRGDLDGVLADAAPDFEYVASGVMPDFQGVFRGAEEYRRLLGWVPDVFDDARVEATEVIDAGDHLAVSVTFSGRGKQSAVATTWKMWQVWTFEEGRFVRGRGFSSREQALEAAGLRE